MTTSQILSTTSPEGQSVTISNEDPDFFLNTKFNAVKLDLLQPLKHATRLNQRLDIGRQFTCDLKRGTREQTLKAFKVHRNKVNKVTINQKGSSEVHKQSAWSNLCRLKKLIKAQQHHIKYTRLCFVIQDRQFIDVAIQIASIRFAQLEHLDFDLNYLHHYHVDNMMTAIGNKSNSLKHLSLSLYNYQLVKVEDKSHKIYKMG